MDLTSVDPRKAECHGFYLFGTGYFAKESEHLEGYSFCNECRYQVSCQEAHRKRTGELLPVAVQRFEAERRIAQRRGTGSHLFAVMKMREGDADPYMQLAVRNYKRGLRAREAVDESAT